MTFFVLNFIRGGESRPRAALKGALASHFAAPMAETHEIHTFPLRHHFGQNFICFPACSTPHKCDSFGGKMIIIAAFQSIPIGPSMLGSLLGAFSFPGVSSWAQQSVVLLEVGGISYGTHGFNNQ